MTKTEARRHREGTGGWLPRGVSREQVLRLDRRVLRLWWERLPGTLPVTPSWTRTLWTWWLKLVG
ncbi:MAG TPA: hypothetical protein VNL98_08085 [Gemmatimonadales bacterium]|nr:hypothetical protein [Gemmatimonadales bacterium]